MKKRLQSVVIGALVAVLLLPVVSMKMQKVDIIQPTATTVTQTADQNTLAMTTMASPTPTFSIVVPVFTGPAVAQAMCDPSEGRHSALAFACYLAWLMEVTDASFGF